MNEEKWNIKALEKFIFRNPELEQLEFLLDQFNIFEVLNIVNAEVRHSSVLAWLLNPNETHSMGNYFLKLFLKNFIKDNAINSQSQVNLFTIEFLNFENVEIRKEWNHIDIFILIEDTENKIAVTIENKIKTTEHSNQLQRYRNVVTKKFPNHKKIFIYLTPDGLPPSDEHWFSFRYNIVAQILEDCIERKKNHLNKNIKEFINQYIINLRRYIVGNSEVEAICKRIYQKHSKAIDLIIQYKPDLQQELSDHIIAKLQKESSIVLDHTPGKASIRFTTKNIDELVLKKGTEWSPSKRVFMFEFRNTGTDIKFKPTIGPGDPDYRIKIHEFVRKDKKLFNTADRKIGIKWLVVAQHTIVSKKNFEDKTSEELKHIIDEKWKDLIKTIYDIDDYFKTGWNAELMK